MSHGKCLLCGSVPQLSLRRPLQSLYDSFRKMRLLVLNVLHTAR